MTNVRKMTFLLGRGKRCISVPRIRVRAFGAVVRRSYRLIRFTPGRFIPKAVIQMVDKRLRKLRTRLIRYRKGGGLLLQIRKLKYTLIAISASYMTSGRRW